MDKLWEFLIIEQWFRRWSYRNFPDPGRHLCGLEQRTFLEKAEVSGQAVGLSSTLPKLREAQHSCGYQHGFVSYPCSECVLRWEMFISIIIWNKLYELNKTNWSLVLTGSLILKPIFISVWQKRKDWWTAIKRKWRFRTNSISLLQSSYRQDTKSLASVQGKREKSDRHSRSSEHPILFPATPKETNCFPHPAVLCCWQSLSYLL